MSPEQFWVALTAIAAFVDGSREVGEQTLDHLEKNLRGFDRERQHRISSELTLVIAQLARLKMRMNER